MSEFNQDKKPPAPGGRFDTDRIAFSDSTGGRKHHFMTNNLSGAYSFPINRPAQAKAVAYHSPKYATFSGRHWMPRRRAKGFSAL